MKPRLMLDLFAGTGGASAPFAAAGWEVVRVELNPAFPAEYHADIREWSWHGRMPDLVWASPPCTEFSRLSMPWTRARRPPEPSMDLIDATERIIRECVPISWVIENVKGASRYLRPRYGEPLCLGPVRLFGRFPRFRCRVPYWKEKLSSMQVAERAAMPWQIGESLRLAIEAPTLFDGIGVGL